MSKEIAKQSRGEERRGLAETRRETKRRDESSVYSEERKIKQRRIEKNGLE